MASVNVNAVKRGEVIQRVLQDIHAMRHKLAAKYGMGMKNAKNAAITPSQGFVLRFVARCGSANVKTIAQALHISSSAATQLVDGLVDKGYVTRTEDPADSRVTVLSISAKAKETFKKFKEESLRSMAQMFDALTDEELAQYAELNRKLMEFADKK